MAKFGFGNVGKDMERGKKAREKARKKLKKESSKDYKKMFSAK